MKQLLILLCISTFLLTSCGNYGKKVTINDNTEVYLKGDNVTEADAKKLGDFWVSTFKDATQKKSLQLAKDGERYVVRMLVHEEKVKNDKSFDIAFMAVQALLEVQAFPGSKVSLILADNNFEKDIKTYDGSSSEAKTDSLAN
ncbi:MAG: hypothetical protein K0Q79_2987 [Flavipsychrobacter sp.]|jgi:hypothetical protein|nr:hypothetical protein [Flavipsychrobacter sp.]